MRKLIPAIRLTAIALLLFCGVALKAQVTTTANITGTVTDPSGAVVRGVTVTATNVNTNVQTSTTTDKAGLYEIRFLEIGTYTVSFKGAGFGEQITQPFVLELDQTARRDAKLAVETGQTQVTVQAALAPLLNTENATQDTTLDARAIGNIPLFGRNDTDLTQFQPGAVSTTPNSVGNNISVNGSRYQANNYNLDGIETNQNIDYGQTYQPNPDAVEQLHMVSGTPSAEYGNVEGSTFLLELKSGTNHFHGNAFANLRNYEMNANTFGNKHFALPSQFVARSPFTTYQFGGTLGGPIIKDKLFAFGDYQGYRTHATSPGTATVPTYDERGCSNGLPGSACTGGATADFSELLNPNIMCDNLANGCTTTNGQKRLTQLFDPLNNYAPYVNNQVPLNNPVLKYLYAHNNLLPLPGSQLGINGVVVSPTGRALNAYQVTGVGQVPGYQNVNTLSKSFTKTNQYDVKVDYKLSSKDTLSGSYSHYYSVGYTTPTLPINFPTETPNPENFIVFDEIHTFSTAIVNDFRAGFTRYVSLGATTIDTSGAFGTNGDAVLGIGSAAGSAFAQKFAGYSSQSNSAPGTLSGSYTTSAVSGSEAAGGNANTGTNIVENTFLYSDTLTWVKDRHTVKFGTNIARYQQNNFYPGNDGSLGIIAFTGNYTSNPISSSTDPRYPTASVANNYNVQGYTYADNALDRVSAVGVGGVSGYVGMRQYRDAFFVQDDYKIKPNLTLNLGLRYEYNTQINEVNNKYDAPDPLTGTVVIAGTAAANAYCPGCGTTLVRPFRAGWLPRVGFNWAVSPRFVVRGGYGAMQLMEGTGANLRMTTNAPFQNANEAGATVPSNTGVVGTPYTEEQGFNHTAVGAAPAGQTFNLWAKNVRPAYVQTYSLGVQYQLNNTSSVMLSYVGKTGQHLISAGGANQLPSPCYVNGVINTTFSATTPASCLTSAPAPFQNVPGIGYYGVVRETQSIGAENDNSLQAVVRQRAWHGLQYTFNFTWSHAFTTSTGFYNGSAYAQNFYNNHAEYSPTVEDVKLSANWNMVYDLPVGRGRQFGANMPRILDEVVGGWIVAMTGVEQTGLPVNVSGAAAQNYMHGSGSERPNQYRPITNNGRKTLQYYGNDPSLVGCTTPGVDNGVCAFGQPAVGTFGNAHYNELRGPDYQQYNAAVNKDFRIWHEQAVNFRCDALNVLNQTSLSAPSANFTSDSNTGGLATGTFGAITGAKSTNRQLQLTVSYHF